MMSIAARFFPQLRNQGLSFKRGADKRLKVMLTGLITLQQGSHLRHLLTHLQPVAMRNLHTTQPHTLFPTYDEVVNLTGLLETKGISVSSGK
jgi:ribosomal protein L35